MSGFFQKELFEKKNMRWKNLFDIFIRLNYARTFKVSETNW